MDLTAHLEWRYATKKFDDTKMVSEDQLTHLKEVFNLTATSYGLQPLRLVVISDKQLQKELQAHAYNQQQVGQASHLLLICIEKQIDTAYIQEHFKREMAIRGTAHEVLKPFEDFLIQDFNQKSQETIDLWTTKQAYIALGALLTACAVAKIDSCPMEGFIPTAFDKLLNLEEKGLQSVLLLPIGFRAADDMFADLKKVRKSIDESVLMYTND